jgi:uncharacterized metal-binding protein
MPDGRTHARDSILVAAVVTPALALTAGPLPALAVGGGCLIGVLVTPDWDLLETQAPLWQEVLAGVVWLGTLVAAVALFLSEAY